MDAYELNPHTHLRSLIRREAVDELARNAGMLRESVMDVLTGSDEFSEVKNHLLKLVLPQIKAFRNALRDCGFNITSLTRKAELASAVAEIIVIHVHDPPNFRRLSKTLSQLINNHPRFTRPSFGYFEIVDNATVETTFRFGLFRNINVFAIDLSISPINPASVAGLGEVSFGNLSKVVKCKRRAVHYQLVTHTDCWELRLLDDDVDDFIGLGRLEMTFPHSEDYAKYTFVIKSMAPNRKTPVPDIISAKLQSEQSKILSRVYKQTLSKTEFEDTSVSNSDPVEFFISKVRSGEIRSLIFDGELETTTDSGETVTDSNDAFFVGTERISLRCPISLQRLVHPGFSTFCQHVDCFDVEMLIRTTPSTFVEYTCPICNTNFDFEVVSVEKRVF